MKSEVTVDRWKKYQVAEEHHQGSRRMKLGFDDFEQFFQIDRERFKNQVCLEIGCGVTGAIHYLDNAKLTIGLDPLCMSCKDLYHADKTDSTPHVAGMGESLPFGDGVMDSVFIYGTLDHCLRPDIVMKEAGRVLVNGGRLYVRVYVFSRIPRFIRTKLNLIDIHPHHLSGKEVVAMSKDAGLRVDWVCPRVVPFKHAWVRFVTTGIKSAIKYIGATILGIEDLSIILVKDGC
jgi:ubiquinone/menaquinone biosynthesis C-methylase UbiE